MMETEQRLREALKRSTGPAKRTISVNEQTLIDALKRTQTKTPLSEMTPRMIRGADVSGIRAADIDNMSPDQRRAAVEQAKAQGLAPERPSDSTALGVVNTMAQVPTATFGDELTGYLVGGAAAAESYLTGEGDPADRFSAGQQYALQETRQSMDNLNPVARAGIEVATAIPLGMALKGAGAIAGAESRAKRVRDGVTAAAGGGSIAGFGSGEGGFENRLANAGVGLVLGGTIGAAGIGIGTLLKGAMRKITAGKQGTLNAGEKKAYDAILEAFEKDGIPLDEAKARLSRWRADGSPAMLIDMGGDHVRGIAEYAAARPNAYPMAKAALRERAAGAKGRIDAKLSSMLGNGAEFADTMKAVRDMRRSAAAPAYGKAFEAGVENMDEAILTRMTELLQRPSGQQAQKRAQQIASEFGENFEDLNFIQKMHYYKLGLDDVAYAAKRSTDASGAGAVQKSAQEQTAQEFRDSLFQISPKYRDAARKYASDSEIIDAMQEGREVFSAKGGKMAEDIAQYVSGLSEAGKEAYRLGVAREIRLKMQTTKDGADSLKRWFNTDEWRDRLRPAFDTEQAFNAFTTGMRRETIIRRALDETIGNSATARRQAGQGIFSDQKTHVRDFAEKALNLDAGTALREGARAVGKNVEERRMNATAESVVNSLMNPSQAATDMTVNQLMRLRGGAAPEGMSRANALLMGAMPVITAQ